MATIVGDVIGPPAAPPPIKYTSSCTEDQRLSTEGKNVSKHCNISKALEEGGGGRGPSTLPLLYHGEGMTFSFKPLTLKLTKRLI